MLLALLLVAAGSSVLVLAASPSRAAAARRSLPHAVGAGGGLTAQPVLGMPAAQLEVIGASPGEAPGEVWAQGLLGPVPATVGSQSIASSEAMLRYTNAAGSWQVVPLDDAQGAAIPFTWAASEVTPAGGVALIGTDATGDETLVTRDPGGAFAQASPPSRTGANAVLKKGESLYPGSGVPTMSAFDEGGHAGVVVAPAGEDASSPGVLHYLNGTWSREPICLTDTSGTCTTPSGRLTVLAVSAASGADAWLEATAAGSSTPMLFERQTSPVGSPVWVQVKPTSWLFGDSPPPVSGETASALSSGALLTASGQGVWVDLRLGGGRGGDATVFVSPGSPAQIAGTWCDPVAACPGATGSLGAGLPGNYGSFAWPGSAADDPGTRIITGLPGAALLRLSDGAAGFSYQTTGGDLATALGGGGTFGPGGETLTSASGSKEGGAAFSSPTDGWLGSSLTAPLETPEVVHLTATPQATALSPWPVAFRRPLLALAAAPGGAPGTANVNAVAVGVHGEIARYAPGQGWSPEFLYNSAGVVQTPTLRGVAWPENGRTYAVGDDGAMWLWRQQTGLWEPDPAKPFNFHGNLTAIAFAPGNPDLGYAVGKQGVLLAYGKTWVQQTVPAAVSQAHFTSVAFAGGEAIVAYRMLNPANPSQEEGGLLVNDGSGWQIDASAQALLATLPAGQTVISKVAGLPDGGAVAAGPGVVLERDSATSPWRFSSQPLADSDNGNIAALAAIRDGASVRALVSIDDDPESDPSGDDNLLWQEIDNPPAAAPGEPPLLVGPDPLPSHGFLVRETAGGWVDQQFADYPNLLTYGASDGDLPGWPDPVLALLVDPAGDQGWAVGGQTGGDELQVNGADGAAGAVQTAGIERLGGGVSPPASADAPIATPAGQATFALGGGSGCAQPCSDDAAQNLGPDAWLQGAIGRASQISGLRAFLYAGQRLGSGTAGLSADEVDRELSDYSSVLSSGGSLPVYAAADGADVSASTGGAAGFAQLLGAHVPAGTVPAGTPAPPAGTAAYAFDSAGSGGTVRVIVLDYSGGTLSANGGVQLTWLAAQLDAAKGAGIPALVVGADDITDAGVPNQAADGSTVARTLLAHGASAYLFYDAAQQNVQQAIGTGAGSIPVLGTGTLGYVRPPTNQAAAQAFLGASGFELVSVDAAKRDPATNRAPVTASLVPDVGGLALDPTDGTLLRRSQVALFQGLARRPLGGEEWVGGSHGDEAEAPDPYTVLPETCFGSACSEFIKPAYTFSSSNPKIGDFVEHDPNSTNPRQVLQDASGKPIPDPTSGLFCAYNPGTTTVSISSGGFSYSQSVTVQQGSVQQPCGTVATTTTTTASASAPPPPPPPPAQQPPPTKFQAPPPAPPAPVPAQPAPAAPPKVIPPLSAKPPLALPLIPPPILALATPAPPKLLLPLASVAARPIPPTGFGSVPVASPIPVRILQEEKKEEEAVESAQNNFTAYHPDQPSNLTGPGLALLLVVMAAGGGAAGLRRRGVRGAAAYARTEVRRTPQARRTPEVRCTPDIRRTPQRW